VVAFVAEAAMFGFGKNRVWFGATKSFPTRELSTYNGHTRGYY